MLSAGVFLAAVSGRFGCPSAEDAPFGLNPRGPGLLDDAGAPLASDPRRLQYYYLAAPYGLNTRETCQRAPNYSYFSWQCSSMLTSGSNFTNRFNAVMQPASAGFQTCTKNFCEAWGQGSVVRDSRFEFVCSTNMNDNDQKYAPTDCKSGAQYMNLVQQQYQCALSQYKSRTQSLKLLANQLSTELPSWSYWLAQAYLGACQNLTACDSRVTEELNTSAYKKDFCQSFFTAWAFNTTRFGWVSTCDVAAGCAAFALDSPWPDAATVAPAVKVHVASVAQRMAWRLAAITALALAAFA